MPEIFNIDGQYFFEEFRSFLMKQKNVNYKGTEVSSYEGTGGSTGNDAGYKILEAFLGLSPSFLFSEDFAQYYSFDKSKTFLSLLEEQSKNDADY